MPGSCGNEISERNGFFESSHKTPVAIDLIQMNIGVGPMIHIKARSLFQRFSWLVEYKSFIFRINPQHPKRDCKIFYADAEEPAEFDYEIIELARYHINHDVLDLTHLLVCLVMDLVADYR